MMQNLVSKDDIADLRALSQRKKQEHLSQLSKNGNLPKFTNLSVLITNFNPMIFPQFYKWNLSFSTKKHHHTDQLPAENADQLPAENVFTSRNLGGI